MRRLALSLLLLLPVPAAAQEVIASYGAVIGVDDLYNSQGQRLTQVGQVLQQDRANLHRWGITQPGDEWDPLFGDAGLRAQIPALAQRGWVDPYAARAILAGDAWVWVTVWGKGGQVQSIEVSSGG